MKRRRPDAEPDTLERKPWYKAVNVFAFASAVALAVAVCVTLVNQYRQRGAYRVEYEGRIMNKSVTLQETFQGTGATRRLLVRAKGGEEFQVIVNEVLYERARVGMWVRSDRDGARLYDSEPAAPAKAEGAERPPASAP